MKNMLMCKFVGARHALPKKILLPLLAAVFLSLGGCFFFDDDEVVSGITENVRGGGITSDSTALLFIHRTEQYSNDRYSDMSRNLDISLNLVSITHDKVYWKKKINPGEWFFDFQAISDSVLLSYNLRDGDNSTSVYNYKLYNIYLWKLGENTIKIIDLKWIGDSWRSMSLPSVSFSSWKDNLILANAKYYEYFGPNISSGKDIINRYVLIDTLAGTAKTFEASGEFEWMSECENVKWSSIGGLCLKQTSDSLGFVLLKNGIDTLAVRHNPYELTSDRSVNFSGTSIISSCWIYLINEQGVVKEKPLDTYSCKIGEFINSQSGNKIDYGKTILY